MTEDQRKAIHNEMLEFMKRHELTNVFLIAKDKDKELANWIIEPATFKPLSLFERFRDLLTMLIGRDPDYKGGRAAKS